MINSVPASYFAQVNPGVLAAGGNNLALIGLFLTNGTRVPIGAINSFPSLLTVSNYFGATSTEYTQAAIYFGGFTNSTQKPGALLFAQYPTAPVAAYLRGGAIGASLTLVQLQSLAADTLTIITDGVSLTSGAINLAAATSFSNAATIIQAAFVAPAFAVTYDSIAQAFVFTNTSTGATSTQAFATSAALLAGELMLTSATGAVLSQGAAIAVPSTFMNGIVAQTTDFASFMTLFNPDAAGNTNKLAFSAWNSTRADEFEYICWDTDITATNAYPATASLGYLISLAQYSGTELVYDPLNTGWAAFRCGCIASIDFAANQGNINPAFKSQSGLAAVVTTEAALSYLQSNGYNTGVAVGTAAQGFTFYSNGQISGKWLWAQPYVNQIWLNAGFQLDLMELLTNAKSIPYNAAGRGMIHSALMSTIDAAIHFGAIQPGVNLSSLQASEVNTAAGTQIDKILSTRGWYLQVLDPSPSVRQARGTPICQFWYTDGGSVNKITLASIDLL